MTTFFREKHIIRYKSSVPVCVNVLSYRSFNTLLQPPRNITKNNTNPFEVSEITYIK